MDTVSVVEFTLGGRRHDWFVRFDPTTGALTLADDHGDLACMPCARAEVTALVSDAPVAAVYLPTLSDLSVGWTITRFSYSDEYLLHNTFGEPVGALTRGAAATLALRAALA